MFHVVFQEQQYTELKKAQELEELKTAFVLNQEEEPPQTKQRKPPRKRNLQDIGFHTT